MASPTIIQSGRFQLARVRFQGKDDQLGLREGSHMPWLLLGDKMSVAYSVYYPTLVGSSSEWQDVAIPSGTAGGFRDGFVLSTRRKGASFRQTSPQVAGYERDVLTGLLQSYDLRLSMADITPLTADLASLIANDVIWNSMVPVDADSSQLSQGVDYGRAL